MTGGTRPHANAYSLPLPVYPDQHRFLYDNKNGGGGRTGTTDMGYLRGRHGAWAEGNWLSCLWAQSYHGAGKRLPDRGDFCN